MTTCDWSSSLTIRSRQTKAPFETDACPIDISVFSNLHAPVSVPWEVLGAFVLLVGSSRTPIAHTETDTQDCMLDLKLLGKRLSRLDPGRTVFCRFQICCDAIPPFNLSSNLGD